MKGGRFPVLIDEGNLDIRLWVASDEGWEFGVPGTTLARGGVHWWRIQASASSVLDQGFRVCGRGSYDVKEAGGDELELT